MTAITGIKGMTPKELFMYDRQLVARGKKTIRFRRTLADSSTKGQTEKLITKRDVDLHDRYPELYFLLSCLTSLYASMDGHPRKRKELLMRIEDKVEKYEHGLRGSERDVVWLWYNGRLGNDYGENCLMLANYILAKYRKEIAHLDKR